jgi:hypothetical protein
MFILENLEHSEEHEEKKLQLYNPWAHHTSLTTVNIFIFLHHTQINFVVIKLN